MVCAYLLNYFVPARYDLLSLFVGIPTFVSFVKPANDLAPTSTAGMAATSSTRVRCAYESFLSELSCAICLEPLSGPVTLDCQHTFCRKCITRAVAENPHCPLCNSTVGRRSLKDDPFIEELVNKALEHQRALEANGWRVRTPSVSGHPANVVPEQESHREEQLRAMGPAQPLPPQSLLPLTRPHRLDPADLQEMTRLVDSINACASRIETVRGQLDDMAGAAPDAGNAYRSEGDEAIEEVTAVCAVETAAAPPLADPPEPCETQVVASPDAAAGPSVQQRDPRVAMDVLAHDEGTSTQLPEERADEAPTPAAAAVADEDHVDPAEGAAETSAAGGAVAVETRAAADGPSDEASGPPAAPAHDAKPAGDDDPGDAMCGVCLELEGDDDDPIILCDGCNVGVHLGCYGLQQVPEGDWYCDRCARLQSKPGHKVRCPACPSRDGVFKRTYQNKGGGLAHVACALFVPEAGFEPAGTMDAAGFEFVPPQRSKLSCSLCTTSADKKSGMKVQCAHGQCTTAFHVTCAQRAGLHMLPEDAKIFCQAHTPGSRKRPSGKGSASSAKASGKASAKKQRKRRRSS